MSTTDSKQSGEVVHTILMQLKSSMTPEQEELYLETIKAFATIEGVLSVGVGKTFTTARADGFTHMFVMRFKDRAALDYYQDHEMHVAAKQGIIGELVVKLVCLDIVV